MSELNDFLAAEIPGLLSAAKICAECGGELADLRIPNPRIQGIGSRHQIQSEVVKKDWCLHCSFAVGVDEQQWEGVWTTAASNSDWTPRR